MCLPCCHCRGYVTIELLCPCCVLVVAVTLLLYHFSLLSSSDLQEHWDNVHAVYMEYGKATFRESDSEFGASTTIEQVESIEDFW